MPLFRYRDQTWVDPRQEFRSSLIHGVGSFARALLHAGEVVEIVGGVPMTDEEFRAFQHTAGQYNAIQIGEGLHLVERLRSGSREIPAE